MAPEVTHSVTGRTHLGHESQPLTAVARGKKDQVTGACIAVAPPVSLSFKPRVPSM